MLKNYAIVLASGTGSRLGNDLPKQFVKIAGKTVLEHTVEIFEKNNLINEIIKLEKNNTNKIHIPIPKADSKVLVTAKVGHIPNIITNVGFSLKIPFKKFCNWPFIS